MSKRREDIDDDGATVTARELRALFLEAQQMGACEQVCSHYYSGKHFTYKPDAFRLMTDVGQGFINCLNQAGFVARILDRSYGMKVWVGVTSQHMFAVAKLSTGAFVALDGYPRKVELKETTGIQYPVDFPARWIILAEPSKAHQAASIAWLGQEALENGDTEKAARYFAGSLRIIPDDPDIRYAFGKALLTLGYEVEGIAHVECASRLDPKNVYFLQKVRELSSNEQENARNEKIRNPS